MVLYKSISTCRICDGYPVQSDRYPVFQPSDVAHGICTYSQHQRRRNRRNLAIERSTIKNTYINPVIRIAVSTHGMLFLCDRPMNAILDKGKRTYQWNVISAMVNRSPKESNRLVHNALPQAAEDIKPQFNIVYHFENDITNRLIYLFIVDIKDDSILCTPRFKNSKLWNFKQIEENMGKGFFSSCFEDEYEHLKDVICIKRKNTRNLR